MACVLPPPAAMLVRSGSTAPRYKPRYIAVDGCLSLVYCVQMAKEIVRHFFYSPSYYFL